MRSLGIGRYRIAILGVLLLLCPAVFQACEAAPGGPSGGNEDVNANGATLTVGGPGGGFEASPALVVPYILPTPAPGDGCRSEVSAWDQDLTQGDFPSVSKQTEPHLSDPNRGLATQARLYNSLSHLYMGSNPGQVLLDLQALVGQEETLSVCGDKALALLGEAQMLAHAALGNEEEAESSLEAIASLLPQTAESEMRKQLAEILRLASRESPSPEPEESDTTPDPELSPTPSTSS